MADTSRPDLFDNQPESSGASNDDFEKLDAPSSGFDNFGSETGGQNTAADAGAYDFKFDQNQEPDISTTTGLGGEEDAEEDRYNFGASEAEAFRTNVPSEPLVSLGGDDPFQVQPSAPPVTEMLNQGQTEPLIDFGNSTGPEPDILASFASSTIPSSNIPETLTSTTNAFPSFEKGAVESETRKEPNEVTDHSSEDGHKGSWLKGVDPRGTSASTSTACAGGQCMFVDLIYWRDVRTTGVVFGSMLVVLLSLAIFSLLSVVAYLSLACLSVTFTFVIYKKTMAAVQKSGDTHPFRPVLDMDIALKEDKLKSVIQAVLKNINCTVNEVRRLFLIEDLVDSIKFGLLLWVFTYVGSWFNGMTLIIMAVVLLFTLPKVYETYQVQIDNYIGLAKAQVDNVLKIVQSKVPFLKKKDKAQ